MLQLFLILSSVMFLGLVSILAARVEQRSLSETLALSAGVGVALFSIAVALVLQIDRTLAGFYLTWLILGSVVSSAVLLYLRRSKILLSRHDLYILLLSVAQFVILSSSFFKYPVFPATSSNDFLFHLSSAQGFTEGSVKLSEVSYPPLAHWYLAGEMALVGGISIVAVRQATIILGALAPFVVYATALKIGSKQLALTSALVYSFISPVWQQTLLVSGTYANFVGNFLTLITLYLLIEVSKRPRIPTAILLMVVSFALLLSHFTTPVFVIAAWLMIPILRKKGGSQYPGHLRAMALLAIPAVAILVVRPDVVFTLLNIPQLTQGIVGASADPITASLASLSPFLGFIDAAAGHLIFFVIALGAPYALWRTIKGGGSWRIFPYIWFVLVWILSPNAALASRFATYALLPSIFIIADVFLYVLQPWYSALAAQKLALSRRIIPSSLTALVIVAAFTYNSPVIQQAIDVTTSTEDSGARQLSILDSMRWLEQNTAADAKIASVGIWEYSYLPTVIGRTFAGDRILAPEEMKEIAIRQQIGYVVVSNHLNVRGSYSTDPSFSAAYRNEFLTIYRLS